VKGIIAEKHIHDYFDELEKNSMNEVKIANTAKGKGLDIATTIETKPVSDLADRTETIIGPPGIAKRYRKLYKESSGDNRRIRVIFQLFKEIIEQDWYSIPDESKRIEQAIKTSLVIYTEGVVVAPIDGVPKIEISKNPDGSRYVNIYYAGPIRAAGGTSQVLPLILGDYGKKLMGLDRYVPTKDEIERYVEENQAYEELVSRQYGCPVCINGEPTEKKEVSVNRDLKRIPHNRIRGGACLVLSEGIGLKAKKILKFSKMLGLDWSWLEQIIKHGKEPSSVEKIEPKAKYLEGTAAGRPIFGYPSRIGGFRLRYGRSRGMGIMGKAIHPATMATLDDFIAIGTQIKVERPGKAGGITSCDSIEGPIVLLKNGEVRKIHTAEEAKALRPRVKQILFLGDLLISYGDFRYSAHRLIPCGYNEDWWALELKEAIKSGKKINGIDLKKVSENPLTVEWSTALKISKELNLPLHPKFIHYYKVLSSAETIYLIEEARKADKIGEKGKLEKATFKKSDKTKEMLERIGAEHEVEKETIVMRGENADSFLTVFGVFNSEKPSKEETAIETLNKISGLRIRDKCGTFIGSRMGRPEAAGPRKMKGNPHVLFPIGNYGGNIRSINKAMNISENKSGIEVEISAYKCPKCNSVVAFPSCPECGARTESTNMCQSCGTAVTGERCRKCGSETKAFNKRKERLDILVRGEAERLGIKVPKLVKGVRGMINAKKIAEPIGKGLLRARHDLHIFRDGTIRYEVINNPLTHFKPEEIGTSIEKLKELGYTKDIHGKPIERQEQVIEILPQDIIIPEEGGDFFVKVSRFVDEELEKFYKMPKKFNALNRKDMVGELVLGLAPHTSAAIVGRILGYSKARGCFAHPYFHQTKRRNCDGDQDSLLLLMDGLLNFSQEYLPSSRGGRMDAPLVFTIALRPDEIDTEVYEMETCWEYPLELYTKALEFAPPELKSIEIIESRLDSPKQYSGFGFTHKTSAFDKGPSMTKYVQLDSMEDKVFAQARLQSKIKAVDLKDSIERVVITHFMPDIIGNTRAFCRQEFRCTNCNKKYRRLPLSGKCTGCDKGNIILTIAPGSVKKYLRIVKKIVNTYDLSEYLKQRIDLIEEEIESILKDESMKQKSLSEYA